MEYKGVSNYHPDWEMESQFLTSDLHRVMDLDSTISSHPIIQEVNHPDQITEIFDTISYAKGASVLRMLEQFMGPEQFRQGVHNFLDKYKYKNAVTDDLWSAMESVSSEHLDIKKIMDSWTRQMGYPILQIEKLSDRAGYRVTQERYLTDRSSVGDPSPYGYRWEIPVTWISGGSNETNTRWLSMDEAMTTVPLEEGYQWVKFNVGQFGFYRVNYPAEDWAILADLLVRDPTFLDPMDRASLINDAFSLAESGHIGYNVPLSMTKYLAREEHLVPWDTAFDKLASLGANLLSTPAFPLFRKYIVDLVSSHYDRLGWQDEDSNHLEKLNRYNILSLACMNGHQLCLSEAGQLFSSWIEDKDFYISPNIRSNVYRYGIAANGSADAWEEMFQRYLNEKNAQEKKKLLYGLARIKEPWILRRFLLLAKDEKNIRSQDYFSALSYISGNPVGNSIVWDFIRSEWDYLVDRFSLNDRYLGRLPKTVVSSFTTEFQLQQIENNIKWLSEHEEVVTNWLTERVCVPSLVDSTSYC